MGGSVPWLGLHADLCMQIGVRAKGSWVAACIYPFLVPNAACNVTDWLSWASTTWLLCHVGVRPWIVSQNKHFSPFRFFVQSNLLQQWEIKLNVIESSEKDFPKLKNITYRMIHLYPVSGFIFRRIRSKVSRRCLHIHIHGSILQGRANKWGTKCDAGTQQSIIQT